MRNMSNYQTVTAVKSQALGKNANTGWEGTIPLDNTDGDVTLFLANSGSSNTLSVTFQIGFFAEGARPDASQQDGAVPSGTVTWVTSPTTTGHTAGAVTDMTAVNCAGSACSARLVLPIAPFIHFKITENDNATANNVSLYLCHN